MADYTGCAVRPFADAPGVCDGCGTALTGRRRRWCSEACDHADREQHIWQIARHAAVKRDGFACTRPDCNRGDLEVNHIDPRNGQGYGTGCWNHLTNLETLCRRHHVVETRRQIRERRGLPPAPDPLPWRTPALMSMPDVGAYLCVSRQRVHQFAHDLPDPYDVLAAASERPNPVWAATDIIAWAKANGWVEPDDSREGRPMPEEPAA